MVETKNHSLSRSIFPGHGQPYPQRQGVGNTRLPDTRITPDINAPITGCPVSATQRRISASDSFLSSELPPHQYVISCSTQQLCHWESGHKVQPSVRNAFCGKKASLPRRSTQRSSASFCGSSGNLESASGAMSCAQAAQVKRMAVASIDIPNRNNGSRRRRFSAAASIIVQSLADVH